MKNISFLSENFQFFEVKFSIYLNRRVFVNLGLGDVHFMVVGATLYATMDMDNLVTVFTLNIETP